MANHPIPVKQANEMITQYLSYMRSHDVDMARQTHSISFTGVELMKWLSEVMPFADELRVCVGAYLDGTDKANRLTAILWPYKDGMPARKPKIEGKGGGDEDEEIDPYNGGTLNP